MSDTQLPGRLGNDEATLATDERADPRIRALFAGAETLIPGLAPMAPDASYEDCLAYCLATEEASDAGMFCSMMAGLARVYDLGGAPRSDPLAWPLNATADDLDGLPPHIVSVNELGRCATKDSLTTGSWRPRGSRRSRGRCTARTTGRT